MWPHPSDGPSKKEKEKEKKTKKPAHAPEPEAVEVCPPKRKTAPVKCKEPLGKKSKLLPGQKTITSFFSKPLFLVWNVRFN